ncbi:bifunctional 4-hydroxy-2-oxoglutarate aldolase/2-dehydro-3-deoxy-phosphogluconate aldolase [Streptomyces minutiscleroticus]|uniref:bifunctional 4-hydroxy-2-oxoglutarate aldolase/2-dehydro-3-deoxy-phosphogluconate aldolase n=1 Tax=Streptomyces minutiscleroticus TaxID=68238 RepID=UPI0033310342
MGASTPTEIGTALDLRADAVKIFPASAFGPHHLRALAIPCPDVPLIAPGGMDTDNATGSLAAGARAVCAGSQVVQPAVVAAGDWPEVTRRARSFTAALTAQPRPPGTYRTGRPPPDAGRSTPL